MKITEDSQAGDEISDVINKDDHVWKPINWVKAYIINYLIKNVNF